MTRFYVTTAIPYVNAAPHLGHALDAVQADILARHRRARGDEVRYLSGTDDNALKNVLSADEAGVPVAELVAANGDEFERLGRVLDTSVDDFIRTSRDPRHRAGAERLWSALDAAGDLYERDYTGLYCVGCERFYRPGERIDGLCPEHGTVPEEVNERNWFFRLRRYGDVVRDAIDSGRLRIEPESKRNEVLGFIDAGLLDLSVSRCAGRARGWGIPVPGDPTQVIYVWVDALANYVSALGYGDDSADYRRWWVDGDERVHVIGKGILHFHAVYWPALLAAAGEPLPTAIYVHDYLTIAGDKISKSAGATTAPGEIVERYGSDALRWWIARDVRRVGDTDYSDERLVDRADADLANGLGNLVNRAVTLLRRHRGGVVPAASGEVDLGRGLRATVDDALSRFAIREAAEAIGTVIDDANRYIQAERPWELARTDDARFDVVLGSIVAALRVVAVEIAPFAPRVAAAVEGQLGGETEPTAVFPRLRASSTIAPP